MSTHTKNITDIEMKVTGLMHFAGRPHLIYTLLDTEYVSLRPLVDQIGLDWRTQKKGLLDDDAVLFYGTLLLNDGKIVQAPCKYDLKNGLPPSHDSEEVQKIGVFCTEDAQKDTVFIRIRRVYMYLARISIGHIKAKGNISSTEYLLSLQEEWADALHNYETVGIAINKNRFSNQDAKGKAYLRMVSIIRAKNKTENPKDRNLMASMLKNLAAEHSLSYQLDLIDDNGSDS